MPTNENELQTRDSCGEHYDPAVAEWTGWTGRWIYWGGRNAVSCRWDGEEIDSPFVRCRDEVDYKCPLDELPARMPKQGASPASKPNLEYFVVLPQFYRLWYADSHEYCAQDCDFRMQMHSNHRPIKNSAGWHIVELFALPPCEHLMVYIQMPDRCVRWEPSTLLLVPSLPVFAYYSGMILCMSEVDKPHERWISIVQFLAFAFVSFVATAYDRVFMSNKADLCIIADCLGYWHQGLTFLPLG